MDTWETIKLIAGLLAILASIGVLCLAFYRWDSGEPLWVSRKERAFRRRMSYYSSDSVRQTYTNEAGEVVEVGD